MRDNISAHVYALSNVLNAPSTSLRCVVIGTTLY